MRVAKPASALLIWAALTGSAAAAVDGFYADLLARGRQALEREDAATAARLLRVACFGLLDEPELLASGLVNLALAQHEIRDGDGFRETYRRLVEVEDRFRAYSEANLSSELRASFEEAVPRHISEEVLARTPAFAELAERRAQLRLQRMSPRERERLIEERLRERPDDTTGLVALARIEFEEGRYRQARERLDRALGLDPGNEEALCLRGRVAAATRDCEEAIADLQSCAATPAEARLATPLLECLVRRREWTQATVLLASLEPSIKQLARVAQLESRVVKATGETGAQNEVAAVSDAPAGEPRPAGAPGERAPEEPAETPLVSTLDDLRRRLATAADVETLEAILAEARPLADTHPAAVEAQLLTGETAYRASRWQTAVAYLRRAGAEQLESRPVLLFYLSVALYESGEGKEASEAMQRALPHLERTDLVQWYAERILGSASDPS